MSFNHSTNRGETGAYERMDKKVKVYFITASEMHYYELTIIILPLIQGRQL